MAIVRSFKLEDAQKWADYVGAELDKKVRMGLLSAAQRMVQHIKIRVIPETEIDGKSRPPVDTAIYKAGWKSRATATGAEVYNDVPYAVFVEEGRRPGKGPPIEAIRDWVIRKGLAKESEANGVAFLIGRAIRMGGIKPRKVLDRANEKCPEFIKIEVERELGKP